VVYKTSLLLYNITYKGGRKMKPGIYKITNKITGKFYVGSTTNLERREYDHFYYLSKKSHPNVKLQNSFNKYGRDAFVFDVIEECERGLLIEREQHWMDTTQCYIDGIGYNIQAKALSSPDRFIDEDKEKIRVERIRQSFLGTKKSPEHIEKMRKNALGNTGRLGVPHDEESKRKIGQANQGSKNAFAKLTEEQVIEIKHLLADIDRTKRGYYRRIADKYNLKNSGIISDIDKGLTWKHVTI
jgi:group I intron endonuclease